MHNWSNDDIRGEYIIAQAGCLNALLLGLRKCGECAGAREGQDTEGLINGSSVPPMHYYRSTELDMAI